MQKVGPDNRQANGFTTEYKEEVITEPVFHKLDKHKVNPSNKFWRDSNQTKYPNFTLPYW